jgi:hypothetical protein
MVSVRSGSACLMALFLTACGGSGDKLPLLPPDSSLNYNSPPAFTVTIPISPVVPTKSVNLTNFTIIPNLPAGLVLDSATGVISGTPTQVSATTTYTVSVPDRNSAVTATLVITVNPLPASIRYPRAAHTFPVDVPLDGIAPTNAGGADTFGLDIEVTSPLVIDACSQTGVCTVEGALAGPTLVIRQRTGWNTYSSVEGALIAHLDIAPGFATAWTLAIDGSYLLFAGSEGVQAITPQGTTLFTRAGDYLTAAQASSYFAGPNEVRVANGPAGAQVIENIAVPSGATTTSPAYAGNFAGWFLDGEKFLSTDGNTVRVYARGAVELDSASLPSIDGLAGSGEWYWTSKNTTQVYRVGSAGVAAETYTNTHAFTKCSASGNFLALVTQSNSAVAPAFSIIDLSAPTGLIVASPALSGLSEIQPLDANQVYAPFENTIFQTNTGDAVCIRLAPTQFSGLGAVAGDYVWFVSGSTLRVEAR